MAREWRNFSSETVRAPSYILECGILEHENLRPLGKFPEYGTNPRTLDRIRRKREKPRIRILSTTGVVRFAESHSGYERRSRGRWAVETLVEPSLGCNFEFRITITRSLFSRVRSRIAAHENGHGR